MLEKLKIFTNKHSLFTSSDTILLTISGGIDSVVMLDLFSKTEVRIAIAHCNFTLRGKESDEDEKLVRQLAAKYKIPFYLKKFATEEYAHRHKISIQMAARELRYNWFEEIRRENGFSSIATAHNKNDIIETFFVNLSRGTGIKGLTGIKPKTAHIIRPLLFASREDIDHYCQQNGLRYREDSSNQMVKYKRNKIRHQVIPSLQELNPNFIDTMVANIERLEDVEKIYNTTILKWKQEIVISKEENQLIDITRLKKLDQPLAFLFEILLPFDFSNEIVPSVFESLYSQPGKTFYSNTHRLIRDRKYLIITPLIDKQAHSFQIAIDDEVIIYPVKLRIEKAIYTDSFKIPDSNTIACIDLEKLSFPLLLRKWQSGDYFYPLGMNHKKKLSDFFIDQKIPLHEKENIWILESNNDIVWIIGQRLDNRFKIYSNTKKVLIIKQLQ